MCCTTRKLAQATPAESRVGVKLHPDSSLARGTKAHRNGGGVNHSACLRRRRAKALLRLPAKTRAVA
jgi:hypothetical protein